MTHDPDNIHLPAMPLPPGLPPDDDFPCCSQPAPSCCKSGSNDLLTAAEVKVLTETVRKVAYALGRKDAGEEIAEHLLATAQNDDEQMGRIALRFAARSAREIGAHPSPLPSGATSDATSGVPGHPEVSEAVRSPQEPHHPVGIRSTDVGPFVRCSCGDNPTPKYWIERHWSGDRAEGERLVRDLIRITKADPS